MAMRTHFEAESDFSIFLLGVQSLVYQQIYENRACHGNQY
jgi:hypothetical protein